MSYNAIVSRITVRTHPNADRLLMGQCSLSSVVVGLGTTNGDLGVYFECDGQLSPEFAQANDLIRRKDPITSEKAGGLFDENRRVRAQKIRGVRSDGFWTPISSLAFTEYDVSLLKEGDSFCDLNGIPICNKYETPATRRAQRARQQQGARQKRGATPFFPKHPDTPQLRHVFNAIPYPSLIWFTEKLHGSSIRYGHVKDEIQLSRWKQWVNKFWPFAKFSTHEYRYLNGTRNVILEQSTGVGFYGTNAFRLHAVKGLALHKNEMIFGELVGYVNEHTPIMGTQNVKDDEAKKQYGSVMTYTYGCVPDECKLFIYRITQANDDGVAVELPWVQVKRRCRELDLNPVPQVASLPMIYDGTEKDKEMLAAFVETGVQGPSLLDSRHIREGVVLRVESEYGTQWIKDKSWLFKFLEGIVKDDVTNVDLEEIS